MYEIQERFQGMWANYFSHTDIGFTFETAESAADTVKLIHEHKPNHGPLQIVKVEYHWIEY